VSTKNDGEKKKKTSSTRVCAQLHSPVCLGKEGHTKRNCLAKGEIRGKGGFATTRDEKLSIWKESCSFEKGKKGGTKKPTGKGRKGISGKIVEGKPNKRTQARPPSVLGPPPISILYQKKKIFSSRKTFKYTRKFSPALGRGVFCGKGGAEAPLARGKRKVPNKFY